MVSFVALLCVPTQAAVIDEVARDFKPISGYVIMEAGGEYLIDLDASKGIAAGDLFSVMRPGKKIIHPVTKKVLGTLEEVKSILKVTRFCSRGSPTPGCWGKATVSNGGTRSAAIRTSLPFSGITEEKASHFSFRCETPCLP
jgi:hypothetical protein